MSDMKIGWRMSIFLWRVVVCLLVVVLAHVLPFLLILYTYIRYQATVF
jgi:hypothetical protein